MIGVDAVPAECAGIINFQRLIKTRLREVDTVARIGSDEFVAILEDIRLPDGVAIVSDSLVAALARRFELDNDMSVTISGSIGVALFDKTTPDPETILAQADRALAAAKQAGRACYRQDPGSITLN